MANTTFKGTLRSEGGYSSIATAASTGVETTQMSISSAGFTSLDANTMATEAGAGITGGTGTVYRSSVIREGGIIGVNGTSNVCHIGQITAARNGTILAGRMTCFETPAGGDPDINVHSATEGTGVEDGAIADLTETLLVNSGDLSTGTVVTFTGVPAADEFLYLTLGATTDADYTAGKLLIELFGYEA